VCVCVCLCARACARVRARARVRVCGFFFRKEMKRIHSWLRNLKSGDNCEDLRIDGILKCFLKNRMGLHSSG